MERDDLGGDVETSSFVFSFSPSASFVYDGEYQPGEEQTNHSEMKNARRAVKVSIEGH
jgi:hypothetical protein